MTKSANVNFVYCLLSFQRKMRFYLKKFFCVLVILVSVCVLRCFWYEANTWYTDFNFWWGLNIATRTFSGWATESVDFYLTNNWDSVISGYFIAVDATKIQDGVFVCGAEWQNESVWQYITINPNTFSLNSLSTLSGVATLLFPEYYAGEYVWCLVYVPNWIEASWYINQIPRKAIFIRSMLNATAIRYQVKVFPWSRGSNPLTNIWEIRFYDWDNCVFSGIITWDENWIATFDAIIWDGEYTVVYKWQSHLASYLENVHVGSWYSTGFDFTTWDNLYWVQNFSNAQDDWNKYQIAGDLKNKNWIYDFVVNWNDISVITKSWFLDEVDMYDPRDLNWDWWINVSDISVIWVNFLKYDVFSSGYTYGGKR